MEFFTTEVLVIGGGIAGMRAAIAAQVNGAKVTLLSKGKVGKAGSSLVANTGHRIFGDEKAHEAYIAQTLKSGQGLAEEELVKILARKSFDAVNELKDWGVPLDFEYHEGIPHYARCKRWKGILITEHLRQVCLAAGVQVMDGYTVLQLIKEEERITGAYAISHDQLFCFCAKAVILATGGIGQLYQPTDNPLDVNGSGFSLAWEVGAELIDMEFVQFYPYQLKSPFAMDLHSSLFELGALLVNEQGDRFMADYPEKELTTRDLLSREMYLQQGNIYLDLSEVNLAALERLNPRLMEVYLADQELIVSPVQHFFMGGVRMYKTGHTSVAGLYVCGEVAGGVHGANRLGGNALTECSVFGRIAGEMAAAEIQEIQLKDVHFTGFKKTLFLPHEGDEQCLPIRRALSRLMWDNVGIVRDGERLHNALRVIKHELIALEEIRPRSLMEWYETKHMLRTAYLITEASIRREESRGAHYRLDFPELDPDWLGHLVLTNKGVRFIKNMTR